MHWMHYLSEELLNQLFSPSQVKFPTFRWVTNVGAVNDHRQRFCFIDAAKNTGTIAYLQWDIKKGSPEFRKVLWRTKKYEEHNNIRLVL